MFPLCNNSVGINNTRQVLPSPIGQSSLPLPMCTLSPGSKESCFALRSFVPDLLQFLPGPSVLPTSASWQKATKKGRRSIS